MAAFVIPEAWQVPQRFRQRIGATAGRQRVMTDSGHVLVILHEPPKAGDDDRSARIFWRAPSGEWKASSSRGGGMAALKRHVEEFQQRIHDLDDAVEKATDADTLYQVLKAATPLGRTTRHLHKVLQELRDAVEEKETITLRDTASDLERNIELVLADAKNALEYLEAKAAQEQARHTKHAADAQHRLNLLAALFFPITAIGSILGMELRSGLEAQPAWLFWGIVAAALVTGFAVRSSLARPRS